MTYINADVTLSLTRLPDPGDGVGVVAEQRTENCSAAVGTTILFDHSGPLGTALVSTLANGAHAVDPKTAVF